jgi:hypothetical protein
MTIADHSVKFALSVKGSRHAAWRGPSLSPSLKVHPVEVKLIWLVAGRRRPRKRHIHIPDILSRPAKDMLANAKWQNVSWRNGTKGRLEARFAAVRGRTTSADQEYGPTASSGDEARLR